MNILFIGINPHPGSYRRGVPFSSNKTFWYLLNQAGLLQEPLSALRDDAQLKSMYEEKFNPIYRFGLLNVINRPTPTTQGLTRHEAVAGAHHITDVIMQYHPRVTCFVGKITYLLYSGKTTCSYGWQDTVGRSQIFVMHFPIRGYAHVRIHELRTLKAFLAIP